MKTKYLSWNSVWNHRLYEWFINEYYRASVFICEKIEAYFDPPDLWVKTKIIHKRIGWKNRPKNRPTRVRIFSKFSWMFLNSKYFFPIWIWIILMYKIWETSKNKLKKYSGSNIILTFHPSNRSLTQVFLTVRHTNFGNKIPFLLQDKEWLPNLRFWIVEAPIALQEGNENKNIILKNLFTNQSPDWQCCANLKKTTYCSCLLWNIFLHYKYLR